MMIIIGMCAIPYMDINTKGDGYYSFKIGQKDEDESILPYAVDEHNKAKHKYLKNLW